ncbi:MAG TPA: hypothetical protein VE993_12290 [Stellaceae bacterium]|nr:hypothetical protein [Stellaceae bacterium]
MNRLADLGTQIIEKGGPFIHAMPYRADSYNERTPLMLAIRTDGLDLWSQKAPRSCARFHDITIADLTEGTASQTERRQRLSNRDRMHATMTSMTEPRPYSDHRRIDERSLAMHRLIARKVLAEWEHILNGPADQAALFLAEPSERATRLRQSSPFCGILTDAERRALYESYSARTYHPGREPNFG